MFEIGQRVSYKPGKKRYYGTVLGWKKNEAGVMRVAIEVETVNMYTKRPEIQRKWLDETALSPVKKRVDSKKWAEDPKWRLLD